MRLILAMLATCVAGLGFVAPAQAALPGPTYVKKAVFVRIHWDRSFWNYHNGVKGWSKELLNDQVRYYFEQTRLAYLNNAALHNIDLILLEDFDRTQGPMSSYLDSAPRNDGHMRLVDRMRMVLPNGQITKTTPNGQTHVLGRLINWVFVHGNYGGQGGYTDRIGGLSSGSTNVFISTGSGDFYRQDGSYQPLVEQDSRWVLETVMHETGHLFGGQHGPFNELADCPTRGPFEIMCAGKTNLQRRFGTANYNRVTPVIKAALQRCNSAFSSVSSCENAVSNECSRILDYTQIQPCIDANILANCRDICTAAQKSARVVINSLPRQIQNSTTVVAPALR